MRIHSVAAAATLAIFVCAGVPNLALGKATPKQVEESLACQCGCGLTVHTCNHLQCSFAVPVREDIAKSLAAGQTEEEILNRYVEEYGEKVLSSPTYEGFNLLAWYAPYVALVLAGGVIFLVMRKWSRIQTSSVSTADGTTIEASETPAGDAPDPARDDARKRLDQALEDADS